MLNGTILQCFHGYTSAGSSAQRSLWQQIAEDASALAGVGFSALWLPPMTKGSAGVADMGYGAYDLYDLGEFDQCGSVATKYGDRTQLGEAIAAAHAANLQVYGDVVLHRKHGGDRTETLEGTPVFWRDRTRAMAPAQSIVARSQFTFPGRKQRYSGMTWEGRHFQMVNHNCALSPAEPSSENRLLYRLKPKEFSAEVDVRMGNQPPAAPLNNQVSNRRELVCELDLEMPEVIAALNDWGRWFVRETKVDGLRIDGVKHVPASFAQAWLQQLRAEKPSLFAMGDYWSNQVNDLHWYIAKSGGQMSLFDVPLHYNFHFASRQGHYYDLRKILQGTLMDEQPTLAVTFVENHNSQPLQLLESAVEAWFKPLAYALILLRREGYPCVFAGDYYGAQYQESRGVEDSREVCLLSQREILDRLLKARSHYAYGEQLDYFEQANIIGWTRLGDADHAQAMAVVISNGQSGQQWMDTGRPHAQFVDMTGHLSEPMWTNGDGWAAFGAQGGSVSVWVEV